MQRFGRVGVLLSEALPIFSRDVVGVVASYVCFSSPQPNAQARLLFEIGGDTDRDRFSSTCFAVACDRSGQILVIADEKRVQICDSEGQLLVEAMPGKLESVKGLCVDEKHNEICAVDDVKCRVVVFNTRGEFVRQFGSIGTDEGKLLQPWQICVDSENERLYVSERGTQRIQVFDRFGYVLAVWSDKNGFDFDFPRGMAIGLGPSGARELFVADQKNECVQVFTLDGKFLRKFSHEGVQSSREKETAPGFRKGRHRFDPFGVAITLGGEVMVTDNHNQRCAVFRADGTLLTTHDNKRPVGKAHVYDSVSTYLQFKAELSYPRTVCVDAFGRVIIGDYKRRATVFGYDYSTV